MPAKKHDAERPHAALTDDPLESPSAAGSPEAKIPAEGPQGPAPARKTASSFPGADPQPTLRGAVGPAYFPVALLARFPYAMMVVGVLTLVVAARDSISLGGLTSAMVGLGTAIFGPLIGAAADRWGQRRVLLIAGAASSLSLLAMAWVVYSPLGTWAVLISAFLVGATAPQVPPMSRSRLVGVIFRELPPARQQKTMNSTMAYESAADEITFVFGPVIVGLLAATLGGAAPMIGAAILTLCFLITFALHRTAEAVPKNAATHQEPAPVAALFAPRLLVLMCGALGIGLIFGSTLTTLTSFMADLGYAERAGLVYGAMGIGSAVFALAAALFPASFSLQARWLSFGGVLLLGTIGLQFASALPVLLLVLLVMGVGIGPTLVTQFSLVAERSPRGRSTTVMSLLTTAIVIGQSSSSAVTGYLAESFGTQTAALVPLVAALLIILAAVGNALGVSNARDYSGDYSDH
ncbi:MFS transporter [Nesterenkonia sp. E16_7]|uniref:MFS transporter n=1 Tax=unclassified Nesterenkonia TaxID=2629769 RepID=UPI001A91D04A|nr:MULTISPECIES: MFS transporter [unclassified Nesterenkonia]MBO0596208.1 MFS transporter [Nesterenkonia sp. E16_10]MBO0598585.1 MFS transporter [Nesterenkonia sp. E16_7]